MWGLGKPRSKLGRFLDRHNVKQNELASKCNMSRTLVNDLAAGSNKREPTSTTKKRIVKGLRELTGDNSIQEKDLF